MALCRSLCVLHQSPHKCLTWFIKRVKTNSESKAERVTLSHHIPGIHCRHNWPVGLKRRLNPASVENHAVALIGCTHIPFFMLVDNWQPTTISPAWDGGARSTEAFCSWDPHYSCLLATTGEQMGTVLVGFMILGVPRGSTYAPGGSL